MMFMSNRRSVRRAVWLVGAWKSQVASYCFQKTKFQPFDTTGVWRGPAEICKLPQITLHFMQN